MISEWFIKFSIKKAKKNKTVFENTTLLKKISKFNLDPDPFYSLGDPGSGSASK